MTGNPYHDETGRFCSREEMGQAVERLNDALVHVGDFEQYKQVRDQYVTLKAEFDAATAADPEAEEITASVAALVQREMSAFLANREYVQEHGVTPQEFAALSEGHSQYTGWQYDADLSGENYWPAELPVGFTPIIVDEPSGNYYGRYGRVTGGKVNLPVDLGDLAEHLYGPKTDAAKRAAVAFLREEGFGNSDAYVIGGHSDYYSERPYIALEDEYKSKAEAFFRQFSNAEDPNGLYARARAYGVDTKNTTPQVAFLAGLSAQYGKKLPEELRKQLAADAKGGYWVKKTQIEIAGHGPGVISVDEAALANATAAELPAKAKGRGRGQAIKEEPVGILLTRAGSNKFELLEGIENYKALVEAPGTNASKSRKWLTVVMPASQPTRGTRDH